MSVMNSPPDALHSEDHLRTLLDQRAARAQIHGRFPSLSEFSDSPSIYSRAHFSPCPPDRAELDSNVAAFEFVVPAHLRTPYSEPRSPMTDRERLNNFPNASSLDLDDDSRHSLEYNDPNEDHDLSPDDEEDLPEIGQFGPKMTVHSRAPWEIDDDEARDQDEHDAPSSKRPTKKSDSGKRVWGLGKGITDKRPSAESTRSQAKPKPSMDSFTQNGSVLLALAQASMSSTSLSLASSPQPTLRDKLSLSRLRSRTPSNHNPSAVSLEPVDTRLPPLPLQSANPSPMSRYARTTSPAPLSPLEPTFSRDSSRCSTPSTPHHQYTHPYANPDLVGRGSYDPIPPPVMSPKQIAPPALPPVSAPVNRSDSNVTLTTDTTTNSSMFQSHSNTTVSSLTSIHPSIGESSPPSRVYGKGISITMPVGNMLSTQSTVSSVSQDPASPKLRNRDTKLLSGPGFPGWNDPPTNSTMKLISLEEAQAQARERSRSATANQAVSSGTRTQPVSSDNDAQSFVLRARSTSAGAKGNRSDSGQRPPLPTPSDSGISVGSVTSSVGSGGVPTRLVTRKKSGFMRLFNARERDKALYSPPPPVPPLAPDNTAAASGASGSVTQPVLRQRKGSTHRVPVPSLSPSLLAAGTGELSPQNADSGSASSDSRSDTSGTSVSRESVVQRERQISSRRNNPGLSIVTSSSVIDTSKLHAVPLSAASEGSTPSHGHTVTITPTTSDAFPSTICAVPPSSAPPSSSEFTALSLRPVSTLFSTHFADQLASPGLSRPSLETDTGTPTTAATAISPMSPVFPSRAYPGSDDKSTPLIVQDDQSSVIQSLQEHILVAHRTWKRQIWELEGQVRDLKAEVEELRAVENNAPYCSACGRGNTGRPAPQPLVEDLKKAGVKVGVVNRPRARTGVGSRFASGT